MLQHLPSAVSSAEGTLGRPFLRAARMLYKVCGQLAVQEICLLGTQEMSLWLKWQEVVLGDRAISPDRPK